jgi:mycothiol system anti-sigma-R factor
VAAGVEDEPSGRCGGADSSVDCDEAIHQLYHYLDGELTDERRHEIARHLDLCGHCSSAAEFEEELRHLIASRCRDRVPDVLLQRVADALDEERRVSHQPDPGSPAAGLAEV